MFSHDAEIEADGMDLMFSISAAVCTSVPFLSNGLCHDETLLLLARPDAWIPACVLLLARPEGK